MEDIVPSYVAAMKGKPVTHASIFPAKQEQAFSLRLKRADKMIQALKGLGLPRLFRLHELNSERMRLAHSGAKMSRSAWEEVQACADAVTILIMVNSPLIGSAAATRKGLR